MIDAEKLFSPKVMAAWRVSAAKESYLRRNRVRRFFIFIFFCDFQSFVLCSDIAWYNIRNSLCSQLHLDPLVGLTTAIDGAGPTEYLTLPGPRPGQARTSRCVCDFCNLFASL